MTCVENTTNINLAKEKCTPITIKVTGTSFECNVYYFKDSAAKNWQINSNNPSGLNCRNNKGIDARILWDNKIFTVNINAQPNVHGDNIQTQMVGKNEVTKCTNGYFKISAGVEFTSSIEDIFWATRLAKRFAKKGEKVDLGESITAKVCYQVRGSEPKVAIEIIELNPLDKLPDKPKTISLLGEDIPYNFCRAIEEKFAAEHVCI